MLQRFTRFSLSSIWLWLILTVLVLLVGAGVCLGLEQSTGHISGTVALEEGFGLTTQNVREQKVFVLAVGPLGAENPIERGVWVKPDGTFKLASLPIGEYQLQVKANGYRSVSESSIFVDENHLTRLNEPLKLYLQDPSVNIASNLRVFTSQESPTFWINTIGAEKADVKVYPFSMTDLLDQEKQHKARRPKNAEQEQLTQEFQFGYNLNLYEPRKDTLNPFADRKPVVTLTRDLSKTAGQESVDTGAWRRSHFKLEKPLPPGDYLVTSTIENRKGEKDWSWMWFSVSDLGLVVKHAPDKLLVQSVNLTTQKPYPHVDMSLVYRSSPKEKKLLSGRTGLDGLWEVTLPASVIQAVQNRQDNLLLYGTSAQAESEAEAGKTPAQQGAATHRAYGNLDYWTMNNRNRYDTYFYTERPVYRLGQVVYFKGIVRQILPSNLEKGYQNPGKNLTLKLAAFDPDGNRFWQGTVKTNDHGTFHQFFKLPEDAKTGAYRLEMDYPDGNYQSELFEVAQYRKPEYVVTVNPLTEEENPPSTKEDNVSKAAITEQTTEGRDLQGVSNGSSTGSFPHVVQGEPLKFKINANYYFGSPVSHGLVKYTLYKKPDWASRYHLLPRPDYYSFFDGWDNPDLSSAYHGNYVMEGVAQTDEAGQVIVTVPTADAMSHAGDETASEDAPNWMNDPQDQRYTLEVEVTDLSRHSITGTADATVTQGTFAVLVESGSGVAEAGKSLDVTVRTVDYEANGVANRPVTLKLTRWIWDRVRERYRGEETILTQNVTTGANGVQTISLSIPKGAVSDTYTLSAVAQDEAGHTLQDETSVWVASKQTPLFYSPEQIKSEPLTLKLDKPVYQPGETARLMMKAPVTGKEGTYALVSIEGRTMYRVMQVPLKASSQFIEIPIEKDYAPNVYVAVSVVDKYHTLHQQQEIIRVSPQQQFLHLAISANKYEYLPGEEASYAVQATDLDGKPVENVEVSLGIVDEAIYAIRPEAIEPIERFFFKEIYNQVRTFSSFPEEYSGGPAKDEPRVRKNFKDTAGWFPTLVTNKQGIARAKFKLPDNLTAWRATARGITQGLAVGQSTKTVTVKQPLMVRLALPRFFTAGDKTVLSAVVHNETAHAEAVQVKVTPSSQFQLEQNGNTKDGSGELLDTTSTRADQNTPLKDTLTLEPHEAKRLDWPVVVRGDGQASLKVSALSTRHGDAVEESRPVYPMAIATTSIQSHRLDATGQNLHAVLPGEGVPVEALIRPHSLEVRMANALISPVLGSFSSLIDYPYGCTEQTMSRLMPAIVAVQLEDKLNITLPETQKAKFPKVYRDSLQILQESQGYDGGWGWWRGDQSQLFLTAYVLEGLHKLQQAPHPVSQSQVSAMGKQGADWLAPSVEKAFSILWDPKLAETPERMLELRQDLAHAHYAMALWNRHVSFEVIDWIDKSADSFYPEEAAYHLMALLHQNQLAEKLVNESEKAKQQAAKAQTEQANTTPASRSAQSSGKTQNRKIAKDIQFTLDKSLLQKKINGIETRLAARLSTLATRYQDKATGETGTGSMPTTFVHWDFTPELAKKLNRSEPVYSYRYTGVEVTARVMEALQTYLASSPLSNTPGDELMMTRQKAEQLIAGAAQWLLTQRGKDGWGTTKATAQVLVALANQTIAEQRSQEGQASSLAGNAPTVLNLKLTGTIQKQLQVSLGEANQIQPEKNIQFTSSTYLANAQKPGQGSRDKSRLALKYTISVPGQHDTSGSTGSEPDAKAGSAVGAEPHAHIQPLYITSILHYWVPLPTAAPVPIPNRPEGLTLVRAFYRLVPTQTSVSGKFRFKLQPVSGVLKLGETLVMEVTVSSPTRIPYVMVEAPLFSGAEVVENKTKLQQWEDDTYSEPDTEDPMEIVGLSEWWWTHQDVLDDRMVFFARELPAGRSRFHTLMRVEQPGTLNLKPVKLEAMYAPQIQAYSKTALMEVKAAS